MPARPVVLSVLIVAYIAGMKVIWDVGGSCSDDATGFWRFIIAILVTLIVGPTAAFLALNRNVWVRLTWTFGAFVGTVALAYAFLELRPDPCTI